MIDCSRVPEIFGNQFPHFLMFVHRKAKRFPRRTYFIFKFSERFYLYFCVQPDWES